MGLAPGLGPSKSGPLTPAPWYQTCLLGSDLSAANEAVTIELQFRPGNGPEAMPLSWSFILFINLQLGKVWQEWFSKGGSSRMVLC